MKISPNAARGAVAALLLSGAALAAFVPALGQDSPESLLPPGFDEAPPPAPAPAPAPAPSESIRTPPSIDAQPAVGNESVAEEEEAEEEELTLAELARYELPDFAKRSLDTVGAVAAGNPSFPEGAFGRADGRYLQVLMRRLDAPVASRWASIALRRALLSRIDTPAGVNGADFAAERAWLLLRMGEAVAARAVLQDVDVENYTPKAYQIAMQVALATADPGALCPLADPASLVSREPGWALARAMCAGLAARPQRAGELLDAARRGFASGDIDFLLAEKVTGTGAQGRRAVTVEWEDVSQLSAWRWGLATATGETVPESLYATAGPQVRYWRALSPAVDPALRLQDAQLAAAQGVFSSAGLVDLLGEVEDGEDAGSADVALARDLRAAYTGSEQADRIAALHSLWDGPQSPRLRYARTIMTARAAAGITATPESAAEADRLIASMLSAGLDTPALAWRETVARGSDGWMMLALADPAPLVPIAANDFDTYRSRADQRKAQLALAGLAGLARLEAGDARRAAAALNVAVGDANAWTRAIDNAASRRDAGTVALLAAVGMQSRNWSSVTPEALFHIVAGLRVAGMPQYARMIAVEAIARG